MGLIDREALQNYIDEMPEVSVEEIRAKAIDEFAEKLYNKSTDLRDIESDDYGILHYEDVYEVAEQLKGVQGWQI